MSRFVNGEIACPSCKSVDNHVIDTSGRVNRALIRRRRVCNACNERFNTSEVLAEDAIVSRDDLRAHLHILMVEIAAINQKIADLSNGLA